MAAASGNLCTCCVSSMITLGLSALFLWLSLRTYEPKCYIECFYVPGLNKSSHSQSNATVDFVLKLANGNKDKGIRYDDVHLALGIFVDPNVTRPIGNATIEWFYQGHGKTAEKSGSVKALGVNGTAVDGKVYFRVDFTTAVRYKIIWWFTKRRRLWGGANVEVNDSGAKADPKDIRLGALTPRIESGAPKLRGCHGALVGFFVTILLLTCLDYWCS